MGVCSNYMVIFFSVGSLRKYLLNKFHTVHHTILMENHLNFSFLTEESMFCKKKFEILVAEYTQISPKRREIWFLGGIWMYVCARRKRHFTQKTAFE